MDEVTLTQEEVADIALALSYDQRYANFTNLANKRAVQKECKRIGLRTFSRTAHGSLLDPRYTVEGRDIPDRGLANDYRHYTPKLYVLEVER